MRPALKRRRRQILLRRTTSHRYRRGAVAMLVTALALVGVMVGGTALGTVGGAVTAYNYFSAGLPDPRAILDIEMPQSTYVYDRTGERLLARFECENRESVEFADLPEHLVNATIAAEDRSFWENDGIDYQAVVRAALANFEAGTIVQGASTITQQVIKYAGSIQEAGQPQALDPDAAPDEVTLDPDEEATITEEEQEQVTQDVCQPPELTFLEGRGYGDKIREQILARQVTEAQPGEAGKQRILTTYLNLIFYGNGSYGIRAAAANYFGIRDLGELTLAQSAFLAGLPQRPSAYDPYFNGQGAEAAIERRDQVLEAMHEEGYISQLEYRQAVATGWEDMNPSRVQSILLEPHFSFRVQREAEQILAAMGVEDPELAVRTGGYRIVTTLDYDLQQVAKELVIHWVRQLADKNVNNGALVAIDSSSGEIVAYVGSVDYYNRDDPTVQGQFDVAGLGRRQPGSAFKPITYAAAFKDGEATPATMLVDAWTNFSEVGQAYRPTNADIQERGPVLAVDALRFSLNIPSVMMQRIAGVEDTAEFAEMLGIASRDYIMGLDPNLTLALGAVPVSLTNMTQAYGAFAQQGVVHTARTIREIRDRDNRLVYRLEDDGPHARRAMSPQVAYLTHWILQGNTHPEANPLWGPRAMVTDPNGQRRDAGFKTGTTDDFRDVSGFGYVPGGLVTGVWMGNNNMEPMSNVLGQGLFSADGPLYLWQAFMERALNEPWAWNGGEPAPSVVFEAPEGVVNAEVCRDSGVAANGSCSQRRTIPFLADVPPMSENVHRRGCLDIIEYLEILDRPENWIEAAETWIQRVARGQLGQRGDLDDPEADPEEVQHAIVPLHGREGLPRVCR